MSRSRKKPFVWISKAWDKYKQKSLRQKLKKEEIELRIDPDKDWEEANTLYKKGGDWGTRCGFEVKPGPEDSQWQHDEYRRLSGK